MGKIEAKKDTISRNQLHGKIMTCIYQYFFYLKIEEKPDIKEIMKDVFDCDLANIDPFAKKTIVETIKHASEAIENIEPHLVKYKFARLSLVEQAILVLGYVEGNYLNQPKAIIIKVAVKLAQNYADAESYKFINAVLEKVLDGECD